MSVSCVVMLLSAVVVGALVTGWRQQGIFENEWSMMLKAVAFFLGSCAAASGAFLLYRRCSPDGVSDDSFRLILSSSGRRERFYQELSGVITFVILGVCFWPVIREKSIFKIGSVVSWFVLSFLAIHIRICLHEMAHLCAARLMGFQLRRLQVGTGALIWSCTLANGLRCEWRVWPSGGFMAATNPTGENFRIRQSLYVAAGPLSDILILSLLYLLIAHGFGGFSAAFENSAAGVWVCVMFFWLGLGTISGLIPHKMWLGNRQICSDAYVLLLLWTSSKAYFGTTWNSDWDDALGLIRSTSQERGPFLKENGAVAEDQAKAFATFCEQQAKLRSRLLPDRVASSASD
jgi:hypothetical protein